MKRYCLLLLCIFSGAFAIEKSLDPPRAPQSRHEGGALDEQPVTSLTIQRDTVKCILRWQPPEGQHYWVVTASSSAAMTVADTLGITPDTFFVVSDALGFPSARFFMVSGIDLPQPVDTVLTIENFENEPTLMSIAGEDDEPSDYEFIDTDAYGGTVHSLRLFGNTWKRETIAPRQVEFNSQWSFGCKLITRGEVQAIGFADSANYLYYIIWGKEAPQSLYWITTYEGFFDDDVWTRVDLPIGEDWVGRFGYEPRITELRYVNDNDTTIQNGEWLIDEIVDVTNGLKDDPTAAFEWTWIADPHPDSMQISFHSMSYDLDSPALSHRWSFGDGAFSYEVNPTHTYLGNSQYTVTLTVSDSDGGEAWTGVMIFDSVVTQRRNMWMAFTGDVMIGRGYENSGGIIDTWGVDTIFTGTKRLLESADIASINLEVPLTTATTAHPTKGIVMKANPNSVSGLVNAGIDFATLANNHAYDYLDAGLLQTLHVLDSVGIVNNGSNMTDLLARRPEFVSGNGLSVAMLSMSDRTGSYNNVQPFLDAGRSRPGFAMWNRSAIEATVPQADTLADFTVLNIHSGSEYSLSPILSQPAALDPLGDEDMLFELIPDTLERQLRQYSIDLGADIVICHHPHIMQGFEVHAGKLIAHSLGNYVFDLNYAETMPTVIVRAHFDEWDGVDSAYVYPVYIDRWIPRQARGALARNMLDYESEMSRRLDTWLLRAPGADSAEVIWDTTTVALLDSQWTDTLTLSQSGATWFSLPTKLRGEGYMVLAEVLEPAGCEVRFGREKMWFGNMEDEGCNGWLLNSADEGYFADSVHSGLRSIRLRRAFNQPGNVVTNNEHRIPINTSLEHSLSGWLMTQGAGDCSYQVQFWNARSGGTNLGQVNIGAVLTGNNSWTYRHDALAFPGGTSFLVIRASLNNPTTGTGYAWFDDTALIEWQPWHAAPDSAGFPNDYHFLQVRSSTAQTQAVIRYTTRCGE
ncbi:CapA family protein [bacterium]|nr:CapA family protein [bacterium]